MCPHEGSLPLQPSSGQQLGIKPALRNTHGTTGGAGTWKRVKLYSRVQEPPCCHLAFLADSGLIRPAPATTSVCCVLNPSPPTPASSLAAHRSIGCPWRGGLGLPAAAPQPAALIRLRRGAAPAAAGGGDPRCCPRGGWGEPQSEAPRHRDRRERHCPCGTAPEPRAAGAGGAATPQAALGLGRVGGGGRR